MVKSERLPPTASNTADDKWGQQVRLACVQAVAARVVAAQAVYDAASIIAAAKTLASFVIKGD